ncbi:MAG: 3-phosphoshikimate 1-carboxyvinyltransferase [Bacteroidota bacterium]|nr:3-phosphoshikimate 1-carboxyvinyltransferase [Bacteroidota bacterium]
MYHISHASKTFDAEIALPFSKSISNRLLIIQSLCKDPFDIYNLSAANDTRLLAKALRQETNNINVGDCGTAFRFLTAFLATKKGEFILTGSQQMKQRPIKPLADALKRLGAKIHYIEKEGFPPLKITSKRLTSNRIDIKSSISSQFISALLLIAPTLKQGLELNIQGNTLSKPYIIMTIECMRYFGIDVRWTKNIITVSPQAYKAKNITVEADWSSLAFFLQAMVFSKYSYLKINGVYENSWQGDTKVLELYKRFGIKSDFENGYLLLSKENNNYPSNDFNVNLLNFPDLAPAYCCTLAGTRKMATVGGLDNLKFKESHRLKALQMELKKINQNCQFNNTDFSLFSSKLAPPKEAFSSHDDHRICMSLAPFALLFDIQLEGVETVSKSFPNFWNEMKKIGFTINRITR